VGGDEGQHKSTGEAKHTPANSVCDSCVLRGGCSLCQNWMQREAEGRQRAAELEGEILMN
jgi:hypothetical protein